MITKGSRAALPSCPPELLRDQFAALLLTRLEFAAGAPTAPSADGAKTLLGPIHEAAIRQVGPLHGDVNVNLDLG
ncbi:hypothetical protein [Streptomyces sp. CB02115]|uniref:hypothetical protein n=1 Tax=Streptomyces sp. CB02115 TaxID=1703939 RepID=UPI000938A3B5|nr:hypothetical protein AMK28_35055 [Streptomyces sp. CB02115]